MGTDTAAVRVILRALEVQKSLFEASPLFAWGELPFMFEKRL
jgi:hypothetical protein